MYEMYVCNVNNTEHIDPKGFLNKIFSNDNVT